MNNPTDQSAELVSASGGTILPGPRPAQAVDYPALIAAIRAMLDVPPAAIDVEARWREVADRTAFMSGVLMSTFDGDAPPSVRAATTALTDRAARPLPYTPAAETVGGAA
jgi:hypothetical protein